jgi:dTDP-4-amino-4,6-dideoxygalactose transaminase
MMAGKSFAIGEAGMITTNDNAIYQGCIAFGHYERTGVASNYNPADKNITLEELTPYIGLPLGGTKHRMNQTASAMGRVQLRHYPERIAENQRAMNRFWDLLEDCPGIHAHRTLPGSDSTMGGWYAAAGLYRSEELGGLPLDRFCEAVRAEGVATCTAGVNKPLHLHPYFHTADIFRMGKPTMIAFGQRDVRQKEGDLPISEATQGNALFIPWFKKDIAEEIELHAEAFRKVAENADKVKGD